MGASAPSMKIVGASCTSRRSPVRVSTNATAEPPSSSANSASTCRPSGCQSAWLRLVKGSRRASPLGNGTIQQCELAILKNTSQTPNCFPSGENGVRCSGEFVCGSRISVRRFGVAPAGELSATCQELPSPLPSNSREPDGVTIYEAQQFGITVSGGPPVALTRLIARGVR